MFRQWECISCWNCLWGPCPSGSAAGVECKHDLPWLEDLLPSLSFSSKCNYSTRLIQRKVMLSLSFVCGLHKDPFSPLAPFHSCIGISIAVWSWTERKTYCLNFVLFHALKMLFSAPQMLWGSNGDGVHMGPIKNFYRCHLLCRKLDLW